MTQKDTRGIAVVGLGFIGLPLALCYAQEGFQVVGVDVLPDKVEAINRGETDLIEDDGTRTLQEILVDALESGRFRATDSYEEAAQACDRFIVTVGLPVDAQGEPSKEPLLSACRSLARNIPPGSVVLIRSTVIPGMVEEDLLPIFEAEGWKPGDNLYLAYASERIAEGRAFEEFRTMPVAVGGVTEACADRAEALLRGVTHAEIMRAPIRVIEASKVIENIQRDVNIAMAQEFAQFAEAFGVDTFELIKVANTHRRVNLLTPGPGVGGYCLPFALSYLRPKARDVGVQLPLLELARSINESTPRRFVDELQQRLAKSGRTLADTPVALFGLAMKDRSSDCRMSPALDFADEIVRRGGEVRGYDPSAPGPESYRVATPEEAVRGAGALVFSVVQTPFLDLDWSALLKLMLPRPLVFDLKGFFRERLEGAPEHELFII